MDGAGVVVAVDDEPVNLMVVEGYLAPYGFEVHSTDQPGEAIALIESTRPDVVLLDVMMPGITGLDLCRQIRLHDELSATPVVLLTALDAGAHRVSGLEAGADEFLMKPIDEDELIARVRSFTARKTVLSTASAGKMRGAASLIQAFEAFVDGLDLDADAVEEARAAVLEHDRLVAYVPPHVLYEGESSQGERSLVDMHTRLGSDVIQLHHSRWDGGDGGPAGEDIPLAARILAIVEHYVVISLDLGEERAAQFLADAAGGLLDPELVAHGLELILDG